MNRNQVELLIKYIDAKIKYEFALKEQDEEGYTHNPIKEKQAMQEVELQLLEGVSE
jgi:hypothetical protein